VFTILKCSATEIYSGPIPLYSLLSGKKSRNPGPLMSSGMPGLLSGSAATAKLAYVFASDCINRHLLLRVASPQQDVNNSQRKGPIMGYFPHF
jgi:hypothetical protein